MYTRFGYVYNINHGRTNGGGGSSAPVSLLLSPSHPPPRDRPKSRDPGAQKRLILLHPARTGPPISNRSERLFTCKVRFGSPSFLCCWRQTRAGYAVGSEFESQGIRRCRLMRVGEENMRRLSSLTIAHHGLSVPVTCLLRFVCHMRERARILLLLLLLYLPTSCPFVLQLMRPLRPICEVHAGEKSAAVFDDHGRGRSTMKLGPSVLG